MIHRLLLNRFLPVLVVVTMKAQLMLTNIKHTWCWEIFTLCAVTTHNWHLQVCYLVYLPIWLLRNQQVFLLVLVPDNIKHSTLWNMIEKLVSSLFCSAFHPSKKQHLVPTWALINHQWWWCRHCPLPTCHVVWQGKDITLFAWLWLVAGANLLREKNIAGWLAAGGWC